MRKMENKKNSINWKIVSGVLLVLLIIVTCFYGVNLYHQKVVKENNTVEKEIIYHFGRITVN